MPRIDRRLGFFQTYFGLTGDQVRGLASVGSSGPKLITYHLGRVKDVTFTIKEEMGFTSEEIVKLLLTRPRLWKEGSYRFFCVYRLLLLLTEKPMMMMMMA